MFSWRKSNGRAKYIYIYIYVCAFELTVHRDMYTLPNLIFLDSLGGRVRMDKFSGKSICQKGYLFFFSSFGQERSI